MAKTSGLRAEGILDGAAVRPGDLATAYDLLARLGPDHPLYLPMSADGQLWTDFSQLPLILSSLPGEVDASALSIDILPLAKLCREHKRMIEKGQTWLYRFFYLELLSQEGTLRPLFWRTPHLAAELRTYQTVAIHSGQEPSLIEVHTKECQQVWEKQGDQRIEAGLIESDVGRSWLSYLEYRKPGSENWEMGGQMPFAHCLKFTKLPFYYLDDAYHRLRKAMKLELWRTSIFCPVPIPNRADKRFRKACDRLALEHHRRTAQQARKAIFERFVRDQHARSVSKKAIAREAVDRGLYPFGTRKTGDYFPDDLENCRRTIYRVIKKAPLS